MDRLFSQTVGLLTVSVAENEEIEREKNIKNHYIKINHDSCL